MLTPNSRRSKSPHIMAVTGYIIGTAAIGDALKSNVNLLVGEAFKCSITHLFGNVVMLLDDANEIVSSLQFNSDNKNVEKVIVGQAVDEKQPLKEMWLCNFFTVARHQNKGYASQLLKFFLRWWKMSIYNDKSKYVLLLEVAVDNVYAIRLYKKHGFVVIGAYDKFAVVDGQYAPVQHHIMQWVE